MRMFDRVRIKSKGGMRQFWGSTGTVIGEERDGRTRMYRISLDEPVFVEGVGVVRDDLWAGEYLTKIRTPRSSSRDWWKVS